MGYLEIEKELVNFEIEVKDFKNRLKLLDVNNQNTMNGTFQIISNVVMKLCSVNKRVIFEGISVAVGDDTKIGLNKSGIGTIDRWCLNLSSISDYSFENMVTTKLRKIVKNDEILGKIRENIKVFNRDKFDEVIEHLKDFYKIIDKVRTDDDNDIECEGGGIKIRYNNNVGNINAFEDISGSWSKENIYMERTFSKDDNNELFDKFNGKEYVLSLNQIKLFQVCLDNQDKIFEVNRKHSIKVNKYMSVIKDLDDKFRPISNQLNAVDNL